MEVCADWLALENIEEPLPSGGEAELIVFMHPRLEELSAVIGHDQMQVDAPPPFVDDLGGVGDILLDQDPAEQEAEEVVPRDPDMEEPQQLPPPPPIDDKLMLDGVELTSQSPIAVLAGACDRLGLRHSGSKRGLFRAHKGLLAEATVDPVG